MTLEELCKAMRVSIAPGGVVIFQVDHYSMNAAGEAIKRIEHIFKERSVSVLLFSDEVSICMVPESRRAFALPQGTA